MPLGPLGLVLSVALCADATRASTIKNVVAKTGGGAGRKEVEMLQSLVETKVRTSARQPLSSAALEQRSPRAAQPLSESNASREEAEKAGLHQSQP